MRNIHFQQLIDYCFGSELPKEVSDFIRFKTLTNSNFFDVVRGINVVKRQLKTKEEVIAYFEQTTSKYQNMVLSATN